MHVVVVCGVMSRKPPCPGINSIKKLSALKKEFEGDSLGEEYHGEIIELFLEVGNVDEFSEEQQEIFYFLEYVISRSLFRRERRPHVPNLSRNQFAALLDEDSDDEEDECDIDDDNSDEEDEWDIDDDSRDEENVISFYGDDSEYSDSEYLTDIDEDEVNDFVLPYIKYSTNNLQSILNDSNGARCVFCLGHPEINEYTSTTDESTVLCPICMIDAVVPASVVPNELTLQAWHYQGFLTF